MFWTHRTHFLSRLGISYFSKKKKPKKKPLTSFTGKWCFKTTVLGLRMPFGTQLAIVSRPFQWSELGSMLFKVKHLLNSYYFYLTTYMTYVSPFFFIISPDFQGHGRIQRKHFQNYLFVLSHSNLGSSLNAITTGYDYWKHLKKCCISYFQSLTFFYNVLIISTLLDHVAIMYLFLILICLSSTSNAM